jgi:8-oxo-dGTP diphosphatase/2-hydroxy-dATP diphosphatase
LGIGKRKIGLDWIQVVYIKANNKMKKIQEDTTLIFCRRSNPETGKREILLGMKKRGFGAGKWNGFGGKFDGNEDIHECAQRELFEESCIQCSEFEQTGFMIYEMGDKLMPVHVLQCWKFTGNPIESDEMKPQWFEEDSLPFNSMWVDDPHWFPYLLGRKPFLGRYFFSTRLNVYNTLFSIYLEFFSKTSILFSIWK